MPPRLIMAAVSQAYDGEVQIIDGTSVRVHQHARGMVSGAPNGQVRSFGYGEPSL